MDDLTPTAAPELDTAVDTTTDTGADTGLDTAAEGAEGSTAEGQEPGQEAPPEGQEGQQGFRPVVDGRLSAPVKAALDKLKLENPQLAKAITRALFAEDRLRRELPGGFKDISDLRAKIEQLGGDEGIQGLQQELSGWREFDQQFTAGDPKVLEMLTDTPEAQAAFLQIAPVAFQKYKEIAPEAHETYVSQAFVESMLQARIPLLVERMYDFLPADNPRAKEALDRLATYINGIDEVARRQVAAPAAKPGQPDTRAQDVERREADLLRKEWKGEADQQHRTLFTQAWKAQIGDRKLTDTQQATINELYGLKLAAILKAKADFNPNLDRYFSSKQKDGFLRYVESTYREAVPRALRTAIQQVLPAKPGPKPGQAQQPGKPTVPAKPDQGFALVNAKPNMADVDRRFTTPDMWQRNQAVLRSGKRVQWQ